MQHPFPLGTRVGILFNGSTGLVKKYERDTNSFYYHIELDNGQMFYSGEYNIEIPDSELFRLVEECKLIMRDVGYRSLAIGQDQAGQWRTFFFNNHEEYNPILRNNSDIRFKYYWSSNQ